MSIDAGGQILDAARAAYGDAWDAIPPAERETAASVAYDLGVLQARALAGHDVSAAIREVRLQMAILSEDVRKALEHGFEVFLARVALLAGKIALTFALGAL